MKKIHNLKTAVVNSISFNYFYTREKNDIYGNPRFRVYIIDPDGCGVYETIFKTYEGLIGERVAQFIERSLEQ